MAFLNLFALCILTGGAVCGWMYLFKMMTIDKRLTSCEHDLRQFGAALTTVLPYRAPMGGHKDA